MVTREILEVECSGRLLGMVEGGRCVFSEIMKRWLDETERGRRGREMG